MYSCMFQHLDPAVDPSVASVCVEDADFQGTFMCLLCITFKLEEEAASFASFSNLKAL